MLFMKNNAVESTDYIMVIVDLELIPEEINMNEIINEPIIGKELADFWVEILEERYNE